MTWLAVEQDGSRWLFDKKPQREQIIEDGEVAYEHWQEQSKVYQEITELSIEQLIGRTITWEDEPIELIEKIKSDKITKVDLDIYHISLQVMHYYYSSF